VGNFLTSWGNVSFWDNFTPANPLVTPVHIQPEWYFLFAYAILRSIPNKLGGVIALAISIAILFIIPTNKSKFEGTQFYPINQVLFWAITNSNPANMNWSTTSRRPIHPDRTNPNNTVLHILCSKSMSHIFKY